MKRVIGMILALALMLSGSALAGTQITVTGSGTVRATPDIAVIQVGVEKTGSDVGQIQAQVNAIINGTVALLKAGELGLSEDDVRTQGYSIYRDYYYSDDETIFYTAYAVLRIVVRDIDQTGAVIDAAFACGCNRLDDVSFSVSDTTAYGDQALSLAVQDAIRRAGVIAEASGVSLTAAPTSISEGSVDYYYDMNRTGLYEAAASDSATSVMGGTVDISATVTVTYDTGD